MLKLSSIFSHEARIESLVIQFEADYQTALKQGLDIYFGVGYATNEDSQSIQAYLVKDKEISLYTTNFTELLSYQASAFLKLPEFP